MKKEFMKSPSGHWLNYLNIIRSAQIISLDWQMKKSKIENSLELFFFCRKGTLYCPKGLVWRGYPRGTLFLLDLLWGSGTHWGGVPGFLLLFSIKSKGGMLCFAEKVPNGRTANVGEPFYFCASAPNQCGALLLFLARTYANILPWQIGICTAAFPFRELRLNKNCRRLPFTKKSDQSVCTILLYDSAQKIQYFCPLKSR